jgi:hypothetical protein
LECGGEDCCWFVVDGGGSGRLIGEVAIAPDSVLKMLRRLIVCSCSNVYFLLVPSMYFYHYEYK